MGGMLFEHTSHKVHTWLFNTRKKRFALPVEWLYPSVTRTCLRTSQTSSGNGGNVPAVMQAAVP